MKWSIIICTLQRPALLKNSLEKLSSLDYPKDDYEIVIVFNGAPAGALEAVGAFPKGLNVTHTAEAREGLSYARNKGITAARGDFIAFLDDDAWPENDWLKELDRAFSRPAVACVGGKVAPLFQEGSGWPDWLHDRLKSLFTVVDYGDREELHYPDYPVGTHMAFRRSVLSELGPFDPGLGRKGDCLLSMEETSLCLRIERMGGRVAYAPGALVHHLIHRDRLNRDWVRERARWQGVSAALAEKKLFSRARVALKSVKYLLYIAGSAMGESVFPWIGKGRLAFFCECQRVLCTAYIKHVLSDPGGAG